MGAGAGTLDFGSGSLIFMSNTRINHQSAFLLGSTPWRESSLRIEVFSRDYGRVSMIARSARKRQSELRGILVPFIPISLSWYGQNDVRILHRARWLGGWQQPTGTALISALYINELVLKLTAYHDEDTHLFNALNQVMQALANNTHISSALRVFEWQLLCRMGFAPDTKQDINRQAIEDNKLYSIYAEQPPIPIAEKNHAIVVHGSTLSALNKGICTQPQNLKEALQMNRMLLNYRLPENIHSRKLLQQIAHFSSSKE